MSVPDHRLERRGWYKRAELVYTPGMALEALRDDHSRLRSERDLYLRLLSLGAQKELEAFLPEALELLVEVTGAHQGYLELHDQDDADHSWWIAHGFSPEEIERVRSAICKGIIAEALATGRTIVTPSASLDPRFRERDSVRSGRIEAVLCAPIGMDPPIGVLYLQRREFPGAFPEEEQAKVELVAEHLAPVADRLLARRRQDADTDSTRSLRVRLRLNNVIGRSDALASVLQQVALVAPLDVGVLLTGDTGTGKSQLARVIHENGPRSQHPFVEVNCAALPEGLIESELFGALPGAHSTASRRIEGKVAAAERGTLVLDEISELALPAQAKLLQLLQSREYYPLGSNKAVQADVRVIAAANADLRAAVREHRFREDLFYRLQVLPVRVPTLAERREDIPELARFFCAKVCERYRLARLTLSPAAVRALEATPWPGNIRELSHAVEAATIRAAGQGVGVVEQAHLFPEAIDGPEDRKSGTFQDETRHFQTRLLRDTLEASNWNVVETARRLDLARSHVYNLIRAFGLDRQR